MNNLSTNNNRPVRCAFTLVELIVVIVIIAMLAGLSTIAYQGIAADLRMSSAKNTVSATLDNARALAIKKNRYIMTVFRPRLAGDGTKQVIDIVIAEWGGDSRNAYPSSSNVWTYDRFTPVQGLSLRTIEDGVNVAGPAFGIGYDYIWMVCSYLPAISTNEPFGPLVGVLYNPEGKVVTRNAESGADRIWIDFNQDGIQTINDISSINWNTDQPIAIPGTGAYFDFEIPESEPFVSMTPILSVFDEEDFRSENGTGVNIVLQDLTNGPDPDPWCNPCDEYCYPCANALDCGTCGDGQINSFDRDWIYSGYIERNAERIQFNRYSGVPLK